MATERVRGVERTSWHTKAAESERCRKRGREWAGKLLLLRLLHCHTQNEAVVVVVVFCIITWCHSLFIRMSAHSWARSDHTAPDRRPTQLSSQMLSTVQSPAGQQSALDGRQPVGPTPTPRHAPRTKIIELKQLSQQPEAARIRGSHGQQRQHLLSLLPWVRRGQCWPAPPTTTSIATHECAAAKARFHRSWRAARLL